MRNTYLQYKFKAERKKGNVHRNISNSKSIFDNFSRNLTYEELTKNTELL